MVACRLLVGLLLRRHRGFDGGYICQDAKLALGHNQVKLKPLKLIWLRVNIPLFTCRSDNNKREREIFKILFLLYETCFS